MPERTATVRSARAAQPSGRGDLTLAEQARVVAGLKRALGATQPAQPVGMIETHISFVLLVGAHAYKIKKCVKLGFLDFSTLALRRHFCEEELRLNRRIAPLIYLGIVAVTCAGGQPALGGAGPIVDFALRMNAFDQDQLWERRVGRGALAIAHIDQLAASLCALHRDAATNPPDPQYGEPAQVRAPMLHTLDALHTLLGPQQSECWAGLAQIRSWEASAFSALEPAFAQRCAAGQVRECHGDLHLGNVTMMRDVPTMFDCLEFDAGLRWTDVMSDVAFLAMDLQRHARDDLAQRFVNAYLEGSGDYDGVRVLRYHVVYRALVRARVAALRGARASDDVRAYLDVACRCSAPSRPVLFVTHGFSGSGKTTWTGQLLEAIGAIRIRADVERKRIVHLAALARTNSALRCGLYSSAANLATQERLRGAAKDVLEGGFHAILDATFLERDARDQARALAHQLGARFVILDFRADAATLRRRILARSERGGDASEAGLAVLENQFRNDAPLAVDERPDTIEIDAEQPWSRERIAVAGQQICAQGNAAGNASSASFTSGAGPTPSPTGSQVQGQQRACALPAATIQEPALAAWRL